MAMFKFLRAGFVRHFLSGFAIGAVGLVTFQANQPADPPLFPDSAAVTASRG
ncbi:hypothetical protein [Sphingomonas baiyangensis]|uniref:hypothetical protein n=1 Tax=Sphingomonas baiyangensis TaxID=2572576 RepID=UPI001BAF7D13|nr:hypothetical protein [Sphingomonas baiyangensis]